MKVLPILLGGDLNAYGMALAFYEAGVPRSLVLGRYRLGVTSFSRMVEQETDKDMETDEGRRRAIRRVMARYRDFRPILLGCTDEYSSFLIREREIFGEACIVPSPPKEALVYADKAVFGEACIARGIPVPKTVVLRPQDAVPYVIPFLYPIVMKPAVSEEYWHSPFSGMQKVWFPENRKEAEEILGRMRAAGYRGAVLLQEKLPIEDTDNYVLTVYSDRNGRARAMAYGRVLLEEHTPKGLGNHAAILTEPPPPVAEKLLAFLDEIGYCGFSNFDLVMHPHTGELYVLEMNLRQGRSNHYMTASGLNPAGLILSDRFSRQTLPFSLSTTDILWHSVPLSVIYSRVKDGGLCSHLQGLAARGRAVSPFHIKADLDGNLMRRLFVFEHERRVKKRNAGL